MNIINTITVYLILIMLYCRMNILSIILVLYTLSDNLIIFMYLYVKLVKGTYNNMVPTELLVSKYHKIFYTFINVSRIEQCNLFII